MFTVVSQMYLFVIVTIDIAAHECKCVCDNVCVCVGVIAKHYLLLITEIGFCDVLLLTIEEAHELIPQVFQSVDVVLLRQPDTKEETKDEAE